MKRRRTIGKEPVAELLRFGDLLAWLPYSRATIRQFIDCAVIVPAPGRIARGRHWYHKTQVKKALNL